MSSLLNLENAGAAKSRYDFPPSPLSEQRIESPDFPTPPLSEQEGVEIPDRPPIATSAEPDESAGALLRRLADVVAAWRSQLPSDVQPGLLAILQTVLNSRLSAYRKRASTVSASREVSNGEKSAKQEAWRQVEPHA